MNQTSLFITTTQQTPNVYQKRQENMQISFRFNLDILLHLLIMHKNVEIKNPRSERYRREKLIYLLFRIQTT